MVSMLDGQPRDRCFKSLPGHICFVSFLLHMSLLVDLGTSTMAVHCWWEKRTVREDGQLPSCAVARKLLETHKHCRFSVLAEGPSLSYVYALNFALKNFLN